MSNTHPLADGQTTISPWIPECDQVRLATLGKLIEECNELSARAARCIIQGIDEVDPDSGRTNREELSLEVSDVIATIQTIKRELNVDYSDDRANNKRTGFKRWLDMIRNA